MTFGQQCSISVVKQCFSALSLKLKSEGVPWYHPLGETLHTKSTVKSIPELLQGKQTMTFCTGAYECLEAAQRSLQLV